MSSAMAEYDPPAVTVEPLFEIATPVNGNLIVDIVFDIEATGLDYLQDEILQIAAVTTEGQKVYDAYILPNYSIPEEITEMTGLEINTRDGVDCMFHYCKPVQSVSLEEAMENFILQLKDHAKNSKINLMAHNCLDFDVLILCQALSACNLLSDFASVVVSVTDTDKVFKTEMPRLKPRQRKLEELADLQGVLPDKYSSHNALNDAVLLAKVLSTLKSRDSIDSSAYTWSSVPPVVQYLNKRSELRETLMPLVENEILTWNMATKAAGSGIGFCHLQEAYLHSQMQGLIKLLSEKNEANKARVTAQRPLIQSISAYLSSLSNQEPNSVQTNAHINKDHKNPGETIEPKRSKAKGQHPKESSNSRNDARNNNSQKNQRSKESTTEGDRVLKLESELEAAKERISHLELDIRAKVTDLAQQQCMNSLRLFGVPETQHEDTEDAVLQVLRDHMKVPCSDVDIDHCHRIGRFQSGACRPIVVKLSSNRIKRKVLKNRSALKGTKFVIWEELAEERLRLYHAVRAKVGVRNTWTSEGRILAVDPDGKVCAVHSINDLARL